jgi:hypothetical protein
MLKLIAILLLSVVLFSGCGEADDTLTPDQVNASMIDKVVNVKGKVTYAVENPMGVGGMYMKLGNGKGEVDVRIQPELWDSFQDDEKALYTEGKTVTVEGILFKAGTELVIIHGKYTSADVNITSNSTLR